MSNKAHFITAMVLSVVAAIVGGLAYTQGVSPQVQHWALIGVSVLALFGINVVKPTLGAATKEQKPEDAQK